MTEFEFYNQLDPGTKDKKRNRDMNQKRWFITKHKRLD